MREMRRSQRVNYLGTGWLHHNGAPHFFRLENISMHGAMVDMKEPPVGSIHRGETCCLKLYQDAGEQQYADVMAQIVRFDSAAVGVEFTEAEGVVKDVLGEIIRKEQRLADGAHNIITLARDVAGVRGVELTDVHFDIGTLIPDRDIHTLRFFAGKRSSAVHLHRAVIEKCSLQDGAEAVRAKIDTAIDRLLG